MHDTDKQTDPRSALEHALEACMDASRDSWGSFAVVMTRVQGKPALAIVSVSEDGPGYIITPLAGDPPE